jgi:hypothetical protein
MSNFTLVTGLWDLGRGSLSEGWSRSFDHYLQNFITLLDHTKDINLIIFIDKEHESLVWKHRDRSNTAVYHHSKNDFSGSFFPFFDKVQNIRSSENWLSQSGWLRDSTQAKLPLYNPMVMSKMFLLHNAKIFNPFNSDYMFWIDAGIANTVHPGYFSHDKVLDKIVTNLNSFLFVCFPYDADTEIHGFDISKMREYCRTKDVNRVARGGFFGGHIDYISPANETYYSLLNDTINNDLMGTEESIFTIMTYTDPDSYKFASINSDGLLSTFFENVKNNSLKISGKEQNNRKSPKNNEVLLYINTFNSPEQLLMVLKSFKQYDNNFLTKTSKILINNSTDESYSDKYNQICTEYNFTDQVKKGNLGVCGGRQFAAEHFSDYGAKYMMFFEDDMLLDMSSTYCPFGFRKSIPDLYNKIMALMNKESYDFLKLSFSEFYGHNGEQWSWHNVPLDKKIEYFGNINKKPNTKFNEIKSINGVAYAEGEIYYSNWPHIIDQEGNQKLFLDTTWAYPYEQTWMSHIYTLTINNIVRPGILLSSPITHNRVHFYASKERKES